MKYWMLLLFLTLGMHGMYYHVTGTVVRVEHGAVIVMADKHARAIDEAEAWRVGDRIDCILFGRGTDTKIDDQIVYTWYTWR